MTQPPAAHGTPHAPVTQRETVVVLDFGGQTAQLIARRIREAGVFSLLVSPAISPEQLRAMNPAGIVLSGGPMSVYDKGAPSCDPAVFSLKRADGAIIPVLGICYGLQLYAHLMGGKVALGSHREFGRAEINVLERRDLFAALPEKTTVWMNHGDQVTHLPSRPGTTVLASTDACRHAAIRVSDGSLNFWGVQFHPEVTHTAQGSTILQNFVYEICRCRGTWRMADFLEAAVADVRARVGRERVVCGLSGGVDSAVVAALLHRAIGDQLTCIFVDTGLLRKNERAVVETTFRDHFRIDLRVVDAEAEFLADLAGVTEPQEKRRRIGHRFIEVFERASCTLDAPSTGAHGTSTSAPGDRRATPPRFLAQGTLYPDVIESGHSVGGTAAGIKLHHNVGGLPEKMGFALVEPLRELFKDEVRKLGEVLGLPETLIWRHPFPGPGLAVRVLGEVTRARCDLLRDCDQILLDEIAAAGLYRQTSQVFAVLLPVRSVGVMGDDRTYDSVVALRAVTSEDFMTADWARLPHEVLARISSRIINEVRGVNRVVYDISSKPPATIEWE